MELMNIPIDFPEDCNIIIGQTHFIKSVEDIYEAMVNSVPDVKFGIAFCEASQEKLVRWDGNDEELIEVAKNNAFNVGCGHMFIVVMRNCYPINVLNAIKNVYEVVNIFCATANPVEIIVAESEQGRSILGVIDGFPPAGIEDEKAQKERKELLRKFGYKR